MTELQLITKAIDRLKMADDGLMKYNPNWSSDEKYKTILNLISTAYQCLMELEKIKVSSHKTNLQGANSGQLQQHVVMESVCDNCEKAKGFYLGTTCPKCNRPFRAVKQTAP